MPRLVIALLTLCCAQGPANAASTVSFQVTDPDPASERELVRELLADGSRIEREARIDATGERVTDGSYRRWDPGGALVEQGQFEGGLRTGEWRTFYATGEVESKGSYVDGEREGPWLYLYSSGQVRADGEYRYGARNSRWLLRDTAGAVQRSESGVYLAEIEYHPNGRIAMAGEKLNERRHGRWRWWTQDGRLLFEAHFSKDERDGEWRSFWPTNGSMQVVGAYQDGERVGTWTFRHQDGSYDPRLLSGQFDRGRRLGNATAPATNRGSGRRNFAQPLPLSLLPAISPTPGTLTNDRVRLEVLVESFRDVTPEERDARLDSLVFRRQSVIPAILTTMRFCDLRDPDEAVFAEFLDAVLVEIHGGHQFGWRSGYSADSEVHNQNQILRWTSLWELTRADPAFLTEISRAEPDRVPSTLLLHPPFAEPARLVDAAPQFALRVSAAARERRVVDNGGKGTQPALEGALTYLASVQLDDGSWPALAEHAVYDTTVTALATLALVGGGHAEPGAAHGAALRNAIQWLVAQQDETGQLGPEPFGHAIGTTALAEYYLAGGDPQLGPPTRAALAHVLDLQSDSGLWMVSDRFDQTVFPPTLSAWMVGALYSGARAGFDLPDDAGRAALIGLTSAQASVLPQHETAAAAAELFARFQLGQLPENVTAMQLATEAVRGDLPDPGAAEARPEYWYFGANALFQVGGSTWKAWAKAQRHALVEAQIMTAGDDLTGAWPADGPWGRVGGVTATTALGALALEVYFRFPRTPR